MCCTRPDSPKECSNDSPLNVVEEPSIGLEIELLQRARNGEAVACEKLFTQYLQSSRAIRGLLVRTLSNPEDRQEMLHEIFLQLIGQQNPFRGESRLSTYVYRVARITIFQKYRREHTLKRGKTFLLISEPSEIADGIHSSPELHYFIKEAHQVLHKLITRLPSGYREVLRLRVIEDLSYEEIAREMSLPLNTVCTKIHKGKKILASYSSHGKANDFLKSYCYAKDRATAWH